jgi:hypothetical protein
MISDLSLKDNWSNKTEGFHLTFDPFLLAWEKTLFEGKEGYWLRLTHTHPKEAGLTKIRWAVLSGTLLWDNMMWWADYTINSDKYPGTSPTDIQKRYFDTFIPMSIEYDILNKKLLGCFWNYDPTVNKYYPFKIAFDRESLYNDSGEYFWSWNNNEEITIVDKDEFDYSYNMKTMAAVSHTNTKVILADDAKPDKVPVIANLKNMKSGEYLFNFDIA